MSKLDAALLQRNKKTMQTVSPLFDELNKTWEEIEKFFRQQGILRDVLHGFGTLEDERYGPQADLLIGIQKQRGEWRICYGTYYYNNPEDVTNWTPVTECSTEVRIELLDHVNDLFEKLVKRNEEFIPELEQAVAKSHSVLEDLGIAKTK